MKVASKVAFAPIFCVRASSAGFSATSTLLSTSTVGWRTSASLPRIESASSSTPFLASISSTTISASLAPPHAVVTIARSSRRFGAKMPGVSISTSCAVSTIAMPRTSARVVCTLRLTIETLAPTTALMRVDFSALCAPSTAMRPQLVLGSSIRRVHAFALQHRGGRGLLGGALGAPDPLGRRLVGDIDRDAEFRIVVRPGALQLAIGRRRQAAPLRPFLQHGFRIAQGPHRLHHSLLPQPPDPPRRRRGAALGGPP